MALQKKVRVKDNVIEVGGDRTLEAEYNKTLTPFRAYAVTRMNEEYSVVELTIDKKGNDYVVSDIVIGAATARAHAINQLRIAVGKEILKVVRNTTG